MTATTDTDYTIPSTDLLWSLAEQTGVPYDDLAVIAPMTTGATMTERMGVLHRWLLPDRFDPRPLRAQAVERARCRERLAYPKGSRIIVTNVVPSSSAVQQADGHYLLHRGAQLSAGNVPLLVGHDPNHRVGTVIGSEALGWDGLRVWARLDQTAEADAWLIEVDYGRVGASAATVTDPADVRQERAGATEIRYAGEIVEVSLCPLDAARRGRMTLVQRSVEAALVRGRRH